MMKIFDLLGHGGNALNSDRPEEKVSAEVAFWVSEIENYKKWYAGKLNHYGHRPPKTSEKIKATNLKDSAILTWLSIHQKPKYLLDLELKPDSFKHMRLLDIGAGPMPSAEAFEGAEIYALDPLYAQYVAAGFPLHYYSQTKFINAYSEDIPVATGFFDAVISVNAIDHVNDFRVTAKEIRRVLKPAGLFAMHVHYHPPTQAEPIAINDSVFSKEFRWVKDLRKVSSSQHKFGSEAPDGELFTVWRNF